MGPAQRHRAGPYTYQVAGLAFDSAEPIPGLASCRSLPVARFSISPPRPREWLAGACWHHRASLPDGRAWPAFGTWKGGYVVDFEGVSLFAISGSGDSIEAVPEAGAPVDAVQRLFLDQVIPLLLHLSGRECLHASAILTVHGACAFLGPAGAGKSTLAACLALRGHPLVADDCLALAERSGGGILVLPGHRGSKLWPDSAQALLESGGSLPPVAGNPAKRMLALRRAAKEPAPLRRIYIITPAPPGAPAEIVPAGPPEAIPALLEAAFRIDPRDAELLSRQFRFLMKVAAETPLRRLRYAHDFAALPALCQRILEEAAS
jgi:hypothetical protein